MTITFTRTLLLAALGTFALGGCSSSSSSASSDGGGGDATSNDGSSSGADAGTDGGAGGDAGSGTDATAGATGIVVTVNGTVVDFAVSAVVTPSNGGNYTNFVGRAADGSMLSVTATGGAVGTYKCNVDARTAMAYTAPGAVTVNSLYQANTGAGNCTVVFTQYGPTGGQLKGTFAGHLTNRAAAATELTSGTFTLDSP